MIVYILILFAPMLWELITEVIAEKRFPEWVERYDKPFHVWSAAARGAIMVILAITYQYFDISDWWRVLLLQVVIYGSFFNYGYNGLTGRPMFYFRSKGIDALMKKAYEKIGYIAYVFFQLVGLVFAIVLYLKIK